MATNQEIERKFLVRGQFKHLANSSYDIIQGYLSSVPERTVRVRIRGEKAFLTIKGISNESGLSRFEWEKEIEKEDALKLIKLCESGVIEKKRHLIPVGNHTYEVDEFYGDNAGLIIAEIELASEDEAFTKPDWLGKEVTGDDRYYNATLSRNPYKEWK